MAHQVYHSASFDRLEHSRGVVEAAERIIQALERNAQRRLQYGSEEDKSVPLPTPFDRATIRFAALLHDVGHGPFSHATENLIGKRHENDFRAVDEVLRDSFSGVTSISIGERIAAVVILSDAMRAVFEHARFEAVSVRTRLAPAVVARILGSRAHLDAPYLSGVISGPLDADKLDYMARDSYHAGLPVALDTNRLINKLEVVAVTPESVTIPSLRRRAAASPGRRYYDVGISLAGIGAYEQMIVGRVLLFDRLYYHHKIRAAEAMVRKLIELAEGERGRQFELRDLFYDASDDAMVALIGGRFKADGFEGGKARAARLGQAIEDRNLYHRAFAVAKRFIGGVDGVPEEERENARIYRWGKLLTALGDTDTIREIEDQIVAKAGECVSIIPAFTGVAPPERVDVILDVPFNKVVVRGGDILTRTEDGHLSTPNLFFDPERWSNAYKEQKQCGFVFAPRHLVSVVSLASRVVFYERFRLTMNGDADRASKTSEHPFASWISTLTAAGGCSRECQEALTASKPQFIPLRADEIRLPAEWKKSNPLLANQLADQFNQALPEGVLREAHSALIDTIYDLAVCLTTIDQGGKFVGKATLDEKYELQPEIRDGLRNCGANVVEAEAVGGGQVDLKVRDALIVENKVAGVTADPFSKGPHYVWQARRYGLALCLNITFVVLAYKPTDESKIIELYHRIRIVKPDNSPPGYAQIRVVVPYGYSTPHAAKAPSS
jgi:hypothetical protein